MDMNNWKEQLRAEFQMEEMPTLESFITSLLASERAHWLRSEIEKLEGEISNVDHTIQCIKGHSENHDNCIRSLDGHRKTYNTALTSIITRYKEELLELENQK